MTIYLGREWNKTALRQYIGDMRQIAGITPIRLTDGRAQDVRAAQVYTGSGLEYTVLLDRSLDIGACRWQGIPLAWQSPAGVVHPAYYEPDGVGWLRSFGGGLFVTCGLDQFGAPGIDNGEAFGIHGRVGNLPAEQVSIQTTWTEDDEYRLEISGQVRQARLFGENLLLKRRIVSTLGGNEITIEDEVINEGFAPQPHMMLYHCNLGFPLVSPQSQIQIDALATIARDADAQAGIDQWASFPEPTANFAEQVFRHDVRADAAGQVMVAVESPDIRLEIAYPKAVLPHLFQWKMAGQGAYVLGLEPANSSAIEGRSVARQRDDLPLLAPGESVRYALHFRVTEPD